MRQYLNLLYLIILFQSISCKKTNPTNNVHTEADKKWTVTTIAGDGNPIFGDGAALLAHFRTPLDVAVTAGGEIYVADALNHRIRKIFNGQVSTVAGFDRQDTSSGTGTAAGFAHPIQIVPDIAGNLYTLDINDFRVRKISPAGLVTVAAGSGIRGFANGARDVAQFGECSGIVADGFGNIFLTDYDNLRVRKISAS
ncbi:MAG: hypothetical protein ACJ749_19815, partial [Flavisolibacter sp.]